MLASVVAWPGAPWLVAVASGGPGTDGSPPALAGATPVIALPDVGHDIAARASRRVYKACT